MGKRITLITLILVCIAMIGLTLSGCATTGQAPDYSILRRAEKGAAKISDYATATAPTGDDTVIGIDKSDTTMSSTGTTKQFRLSDLPISTPTQSALDLKIDKTTISPMEAGKWCRTNPNGLSIECNQDPPSGSGAETDPIVGAINGIVKADGAGNISAAIPDTDYLTPSTGAATYQTQAGMSTAVPANETDPAFSASAAASITNAGSGEVITSAERTKLNNALVGDGSESPAFASVSIGNSGLTPIHVANLPATPTEGMSVWVDDATDTCTMGSGGGSAKAEFSYDGSTWIGKMCASTGSDNQAIHVNQSGEIYGLTAKGTPVDPDVLVLENSASSWAKVKVALTDLWGNYLKGKADALYLTPAALTATLGAEYDTEAELAALFAGKVSTSGDETIAGVKTFSSFLITPSGAPTANYQVANKKYVDDHNTFQTLGIACLSAAPGSPVSGNLYCSDGANWQPGGSGQGTDHWLGIYNGSAYFWFWDLTAGTRIGRDNVQNPSLESGATWSATGIALYGGSYLVTATGAGTIDAAASGMSFDVGTEGTAVATINPDASDTIYNNGTACTAGHGIASSGTAGDQAVFRYRSANAWSVASFGFTCQ